MNMVTDIIWLSHCLHYYGSFFFFFRRVSLYFKIATTIFNIFDQKKFFSYAYISTIANPIDMI